ncbi:MAG: MerR family transcriptional regulator [Bacteroidetes bacterium]|nr:MerR family transcriptional regulator [Bacteroidota bacterium]
MSGCYSIKDLERLTGIKAHTIRIWEKRYNIVQPERTESNIRCYSDENLKKLLNVSILVKNGYKISRIADFEDADINEKILEVSRMNNHHSNQVESLIVSMIELDESKFEKILNTAIIKLGFESTVFEIISPLFEKIGVLWQTGSINPAQEHFISNLIRRKLFVAIDGLSTYFEPGAKKVTLYLPEWELHEIGLLLYDYLLRKHGIKTFFLGQSLPIHDLVAVSRVQVPDYILTVFTSSLPVEELNDYLLYLSGSFPNVSILVTGMQTVQEGVRIPSNVLRFDGAKDFKDKILDKL